MHLFINLLVLTGLLSLGALGWRSGQGTALLVGRSRNRFPGLSVIRDFFPWLPTENVLWGRLSL
jgi:hypothetical protein